MLADDEKLVSCLRAQTKLPEGEVENYHRASYYSAVSLTTRVLAPTELLLGHRHSGTMSW